MTLGTHLTFPGTCEAAFRFYERVLDGKIGLLQTYGESPGAERVAPEWRAKIIHASITIAGRELAGADIRPGCALPLTLAWEYPTIAVLASHLIEVMQSSRPYTQREVPEPGGMLQQPPSSLQ